jgi:hypothetical protein
VKVRIIQGRNLLAADSNGKSDPYCKVWITGAAAKTEKTHVKKKTLSPNWDEKFVFPVNSPQTDTIMIECFDWDAVGKDDSLGGCSVGLMGLVTGAEKTMWLPLNTQGDIEVGLTAVAFDSSGLRQEDRLAVQAGVGMDPSTSLQSFAPPQRWEIKDPSKFYGKSRKPNKFGWIQLFFNKPYYLGGEIVVGRVDLNVTSPIQAKELKIKWKGFEKTYIENSVTYKDPVTNQMRTRVDVYKDNKTFFKQVATLAAFNGGILAPGTWSWNFQYQLPADLPSVFFDKHIEFDGDKIKAGVMYEVKVWVDMPGSDIKAKENIIISELVTQRILPVSDKKIKSFVFAKGKLEFSADIGKDVFCPGENVPIHVKVVNPTSKKINALKIRLVAHITVKAGLFTKHFIKRVSDTRFPGSDKHSNIESVLPVTLPSDIYPTTNGHLVKCKYELVVECDLPMAFDLQISPKVVMALLPAPDTTYAMMGAITGGWGAF